MNDQTDNLSTSLRDLIRECRRLRKLINAQTGKQLQSDRIRGEVRALVQTFFRAVRPSLTKLSIDTSGTDTRMQRLLELASGSGSITQYKLSFRELTADLNKHEIEIERNLSDIAVGGGVTGPSAIEARILATIAAMLPMTARSYQQVIADLAGTDRISYRGTATELREILRETLDYLAPDKDVVQSQGFQFDKDRTRPTMAQKVRYILGQRGLPKNSIEAPRKAIEVVEGAVSSLVRSTYDRGSIDTHTSAGITKPGAMQLKMYVDSVLCELLEIHSKA